MCGCPHFLFGEVSCLYSESEVLLDMTVIRAHRRVAWLVLSCRGARHYILPLRELSIISVSMNDRLVKLFSPFFCFIIQQSFRTYICIKLHRFSLKNLWITFLRPLFTIFFYVPVYGTVRVLKIVIYSHYAYRHVVYVWNILLQIFYLLD